MDKLPFYVLDVFAETPLAGNQLAVFRQAQTLESTVMQRIAREINFSETTFILSDEPRQGGFDVRIFTPREEVPFAGHPTLGTAFLINREILKRESGETMLNLKAGQIPVSFDAQGHGWMKQMPPVFGADHSASSLAPVLGLETADIDERFPIQEVSTGLPFFIVPLKTIQALKSAKPNREKYFDLIQHTEAKGILIFCPQTRQPENQISVRVFVEYYGIPEDPATGSGNGCLAGYLVKQRFFGGESIELSVEQGYEIGRPSLLLLKAREAHSGIEVSVGGKCFLVARGEFSV